MAKKMTVLGITLIVLFSLVLLTGCSIWRDRSHNYTIEEHIEIVYARVQREFIESGEFENFEIHPIFTPDGDFSNFLLVEFAPLGFIYVRIWYVQRLYSNGFIGGFFRRYPQYQTTALISDEMSHFYGINESRYFFVIESDLNFPANDIVIPAVRRGGTFLNLISLEEMSNETSLEIQDSTSLKFYRII